MGTLAAKDDHITGVTLPTLLAKNKPSPKPIPAPRSDHTGRTLAVSHEQLYRAMRRFLTDLSRAEDEYRVEVSATRDKLGIAAEYEETPDVHRYSFAVQVFAAMTIEAAISFYAVLRFGGEHHDKHFRWDASEKRLASAFRFAGLPLADDAQILTVVNRVMKARHAIVHPFSTEYLGDEQATISAPDRPEPDESAAAARDIAADVDTFFALLRDTDKEHAHFFVLA